MNNICRHIKAMGSISLLIFTFNSQANDLTIPNQFASDSRAVAAEVNANFDAAAASINDNQTQLTDLIAQITALTATVTSLQAEVDTLKTDSVTGLSEVLSVDTDNQGNPAAIFSGVNLHVNNGTGERSQVNGLGNFIVGYDEISTSTVQICSSGFYTDQASCENVGRLWSNSHKSGSHNLIVGARHNYSSFGAFISGQGNSVNRQDASILGGTGNLASGNFSIVSGGVSNTASGEHSSVSGGDNNLASGTRSSISGGFTNIASGQRSSVSGGLNNESQGNFTSILGGNNNLASSDSSSVSGGNSNTASGAEANVAGGINNTASGFRSTVSGGSSREAAGGNDWVAGTLFEDN